MSSQVPKGILALLFVTSFMCIHSQTDSPSPEAKSVVEQIKEQTIAFHTGVNVTASNSTAPTAQNITEMARSPARSMVPSQAPTPMLAPHPSASVPVQPPDLAPHPAQPPMSNSSMPPTTANSTVANSAAAAEGSAARSTSPVMTPNATPIANASASDVLTDTTGVNVTEIAASAKDATVAGAAVASSRYGSVIAGTLVAAVMLVGLAGTVMVWRHRSASAYQGLHDTELAMIRREH